ncbi:hypothetical protein [Nonomuraea diastatica]|uniref:Uncharacterized protein n=1 Tax=Nonomuraea diastatica TaxID=1848329 RepID=A0A4R4WE19_9ACTN|nr:hypothetical protein [Nonomuraea diastatica]TDD17179.1 hypothetical protein E1294_28665 [Nonomuraea diastatica]
MEGGREPRKKLQFVTLLTLLSIVVALGAWLLPDPFAWGPEPGSGAKGDPPATRSPWQESTLPPKSSESKGDEGMAYAQVYDARELRVPAASCGTTHVDLDGPVVTSSDPSSTPELEYIDDFPCDPPVRPVLETWPDLSISEGPAQGDPAKCALAVNEQPGFANKERPQAGRHFCLTTDQGLVVSASVTKMEGTTMYLLVRAWQPAGQP